MKFSFRFQLFTFSSAKISSEQLYLRRMSRLLTILKTKQYSYIRLHRYCINLKIEKKIVESYQKFRTSSTLHFDLCEQKVEKSRWAAKETKQRTRIKGTGGATSIFFKPRFYEKLISRTKRTRGIVAVLILFIRHYENCRTTRQDLGIKFY